MNSLQPLIIESVQLLFIGMGSVFIILSMLIILITAVSKILAKFNLNDPPPSMRSAKPVRKNVSTTNNNEIVAVISSAIQAHKKKHSIN